ncbi:hypothetical protein HELRODRAFT_135178, partial [Helobdella robusta]|uniref:Methyltransferase domain-containing protein n=1 Tax=Helobdella robusta TaxID=6412 RepID=T1EI70_HELRO
ERNRDPILNVLKQIISPDGLVNVLEIASGWGYHVTYFAKFFDNVKWQPTDGDQSCVNKINQKLASSNKNNSNISKPLAIDATTNHCVWFNGMYQRCHFDCILCINMTHISKWQATEGLFSGSNYYLKPNGSLVIYGPFIVYGDFIHKNNISFDKQLKSQTLEWGLRDVSQLNKVAEDNGMKLEKIFDMPANNKTLIYRKH